MRVTYPCMGVRLVPAHQVVPNDYNPNKVASKEYDLLVHSIEEDGLTLPIVTCYNPERDVYEIVDGYHRWSVLTQVFGCDEIPVVTIDKDISQRRASTVRHNRARGKHQVDLQAALVRSLMHEGLDDEAIAKAMGMAEEEILRLKQVVGAAHMMAAEEYGEFYGRDDEPPLPPEDEP